MEQILPRGKYDRRHRAVSYPGGNGRRAYPLETMLRIHCMALVQPERMRREDTLYEIASMRLFHQRIILDDALPDRTTIMISAGSSINWPASCSRPSIAGWQAGVMMTRDLWSMPPSLGTQLDQEAKEQQRDPSLHQLQERQSVALWHEGPRWCR